MKVNKHYKDFDLKQLYILFVPPSEKLSKLLMFCTHIHHTLSLWLTCSQLTLSEFTYLHFMTLKVFTLEFFKEAFSKLPSDTEIDVCGNSRKTFSNHDFGIAKLLKLYLYFNLRTYIQMPIYFIEKIIPLTAIYFYFFLQAYFTPYHIWYTYIYMRVILLSQSTIV